MPDGRAGYIREGKKKSCAGTSQGREIGQMARAAQNDLGRRIDQGGPGALSARGRNGGSQREKDERMPRGCLRRELGWASTII